MLLDADRTVIDSDLPAQITPVSGKSGDTIELLVGLRYDEIGAERRQGDPRLAPDKRRLLAERLPDQALHVSMHLLLGPVGVNDDNLLGLLGSFCQKSLPHLL